LNSLRGAVLVQGLCPAMLLRERVHGLPITETHPKDLLRLLGIAGLARGHADVPLADVGESRAIQTAMMSPLTWISKSGSFVAECYGHVRATAWRRESRSPWGR